MDKSSLINILVDKFLEIFFKRPMVFVIGNNNYIVAEDSIILGDSNFVRGKNNMVIGRLNVCIEFGPRSVVIGDQNTQSAHCQHTTKDIPALHKKVVDKLQNERNIEPVVISYSTLSLSTKSIVLFYKQNENIAIKNLPYENEADIQIEAVKLIKPLALKNVRALSGAPKKGQPVKNFVPSNNVPIVNGVPINSQVGADNSYVTNYKPPNNHGITNAQQIIYSPKYKNYAPHTNVVHPMIMTQPPFVGHTKVSQPISANKACQSNKQVIQGTLVRDNHINSKQIVQGVLVGSTQAISKNGPESMKMATIINSITDQGSMISNIIGNNTNAINNNNVSNNTNVPNNTNALINNNITIETNTPIITNTLISTSTTNNTNTFSTKDNNHYVSSTAYSEVIEKTTNSNEHIDLTAEGPPTKKFKLSEKFEEGSCTICTEEKATILSMPCLHLSRCESCSVLDKTKRCTLCLTSEDERKKVFLS